MGRHLLPHTPAVSRAKLIARRATVIAVPFLTGIGVALTLFACCCPGGVARDGAVAPFPAPPIGLAHFDEPAEVAPSAHMQAEMHNVRFHVDPTIVLNLYPLRTDVF